MDEPLAALDLPTRLAFLRFLKRVHREFALPILYVSHDLSSVLNFADAVVLLPTYPRYPNRDVDRNLEVLRAYAAARGV